MNKHELMKIDNYEEFDRLRGEMKNLKLDREMREHIMKLFPKASGTTEELYKIPRDKGGTIGS